MYVVGVTMACGQFKPTYGRFSGEGNNLFGRDCSKLFSLDPFGKVVDDY